MKLSELTKNHQTDVKIGKFGEKSTKQEEKTQERCDELLQKIDLKKNELKKLASTNNN